MSAIARFRRAGLVAGLLSLVPAVAFAHPGHGGAAGHDFLHGFMHPLHGMDHFLAMVAVGLWAAQRDRRSVWALPIAFVAFMAVGFVLGAGGVAMPAVELGIAASVLVLGIAVALAARIPTVGAVALVALFALFHGHAHGAELPAGMAASLFGAGFATSTALLHGAGIALAVGLRHAVMARSVGIERAIGAGIAAAGLALLLV
ncbi:MAG: HupE/UreJ family protein [Candidatus Cloacimonetes bacterium]|jgi:urease accessory protein|nr:HupE/UreJ family protein [Candidatus Cloacimonadota bacterium]